MDFKPQPLSVRELLTNADSLYQIPAYQRPYKWGTDEVVQLWNDIRSAYEKQTNGKARDYFLGAMVTAKPAGRGKYLDVVDGQQRLTTLVILCCVIRDKFSDINQDSEYGDRPVTVQDINLALFEYGDTAKARLKLRTRDHAMTDFQSVIEKNGTVNLSRPTKKQLSGDDPRHKFHNAAIELQECLQDIGTEEVAKILNFLFDRVKVMRIDCEEVGSAIRIFQIINTRGLDLSEADLVKSHLLQILSDECGDDEENRRQQEEQFLSDWRTAEQHVESSDLKDMGVLVALYGYYKSADTPQDGLYEDMQKLFDGERKESKPNVACGAAGELKQFAENYEERIHGARDRVIYSLRYLRWHMLWKSVLLTAFAEHYPDSDQLARAMRRFYYLHWIAGKTLTSVKPVSFKVIKDVKAKKPIGEIQQMLEEKVSEDGVGVDQRTVVRRAISALKSDSVADEPWCKPLLLMMEYAATDDSKLSYIELDKYLHLEHVLAQGHGKQSGWGHIDESVAGKYLNSGGNLTLLGGKKNKIASNKPFDEKIAVYEGRGTRGGDNRITAFQITQNIVSDFRQKKYQKQWNENAMRDRKVWFLGQAEEILGIDIPDKD